MNCREIDEFSPLFLSGEMEESQRAEFQAHLAQCRHCAQDLDWQAALDALVARAGSTELPDAAAVQQAVRRRIGAQRLHRFAALAAALAIACLLGFLALRATPPPRIYTDAALDHRLEVMEHQPRRWRTDPAEVAKLAARYDLPDLASLAPWGYRLEHAKMCGIAGKPALHLVYSNGSREFSLYVRARFETASRVLKPVRVGPEEMIAFRTDRLDAVVVTTGSSGECLELARFAERVL